MNQLKTKKRKNILLLHVCCCCCNLFLFFFGFYYSYGMESTSSRSFFVCFHIFFFSFGFGLMWACIGMHACSPYDRPPGWLSVCPIAAGKIEFHCIFVKDVCLFVSLSLVLVTFCFVVSLLPSSSSFFVACLLFFFGFLLFMSRLLRLQPGVFFLRKKYCSFCVNVCKCFV